jgi:GTPase SAR1 family protein
MSQPTLGDRILRVIIGTLGNLVPSGISNSVNTVVDFAYVRVLGLPFIVLGYRQSGKTTLLEWLKRDTTYLQDFDPDPTAAGGDAVSPFGSQIGEEVIRLKPRRDVGGEYAMWETDWIDLFREAKPRGIIFMLDHTNLYQHKDALNFVLQMIDEEPEASRNLKMFLLMVNKSDLWPEGTTLDTLLEDFRNETRRLKSQAERIGYHYKIVDTSLMTDANINDAMRSFFNAIRPKADRKKSAQPEA